jgi:tetraacyldisaccharide 4'-kinase
MSVSNQRRVLRILSGEDRRWGASATRAALRLVEPFYAGVTAARNRLYDRGTLTSHPLPRPVISVGNITTGGTGKTPVVRWLAEQLAARGLRAVVLMRGYRAEQTGGSDEQRMLADYLAGRAGVIANPDRLAGAAAAMQQDPPPDVFLLDDGFQHRRVRRDLDLVLIDATAPFGHGHVLPRGLLREPLRGLRRAGAFLVTRSNLVEPAAVGVIEAQLRRWNPAAPVFRTEHALDGLKPTDVPAGEPPEFPMDDLLRRRFFVFAGIANPAALARQLEPYRASLAGARWFPDHHAYTSEQVTELSRAATESGAEIMITTEKDWVKLAALPGIPDAPPILRIELRLLFRDDDERRLLDLIWSKVPLPADPLPPAPAVPPSPAVSSA